MLKSEVLKHFKTNVAVAEALGISDAAVSQWGDLVPVMAAYELAEKTGGALRFDAQMYSHSVLRVRKIAERLATAS